MIDFNLNTGIIITIGLWLVARLEQTRKELCHITERYNKDHALQDD